MTAVADFADLGAARVQVADDIAQKLLGRHHFQRHDGFEQHGAGLFHGTFEGVRAGHLEGKIGRVHLVELPIEQDDLDVDQLVTTQEAVAGGGADAMFDRLDVFTRDRAALDLGLEGDVVVLVVDERLDADLGDTELAVTAGLLNEAAFGLGGTGDGFAVADARAAHVGIHAVFADQFGLDDFQVQFAHAADDQLARLVVELRLEGRIFLAEFYQGLRQAVLIAGRLGLDGHGHDRVGEVHGFERDRLLFVAERVARVGEFKARDGDDFAGARFFDHLAIVGMHQVHAVDAFSLLADRVVDAFAALQDARVDADEGQVTVLVEEALEAQRGQRLVAVRLAFDPLSVILDVVTDDMAHVARRRQVGDHGIQHRLDADEVVGRTT